MRFVIPLFTVLGIAIYCAFGIVTYGVIYGGPYVASSVMLWAIMLVWPVLWFITFLLIWLVFEMVGTLFAGIALLIATIFGRGRG